MSEKVLAKGMVLGYDTPQATLYFPGGKEVRVPVSQMEAVNKAMDNGHEIEVVDCVPGQVSTIVRVLPKVVVKARGKVLNISTATSDAWVGGSEPFHVDNICDAARAYADDAEVEIVSIDGGPDQVRVCK